jgi:hypothetical protein
MGILNKRQIIEVLKNQNLKIGAKALKKFVELEEKNIKKDIERFSRNAKISGRKVLKEADLE